MKNFDQFLTMLSEYKATYGDLNIPSKYVTEDGVKLGAKVRYVRKGEVQISIEEKLRLDEIGFIWKVREHYKSFEEVYNLLVAYKKKFGNLEIAYKYITEDGTKLGLLVSYLRCGKFKITENQRKQLDDMGFVWSAKITYSFESICDMLEEYKKEYDNMMVPIKYVTRDGIPLGTIVNNIRQGYRFTTDQEKRKLDELGFVWHIRRKKIPFNEVYKLLVEYKKTYGNLDVSSIYVTPSGIKLGKIVASIRNGERRITNMQREKLDEIGFVCMAKYRKISFDEFCKLLSEYKKENGNLDIPYDYQTAEGKKLGCKVYSIRVEKNKLREDQVYRLNELGFEWQSKYNKVTSFDEIYDMLEEFKRENGHLYVPRKYVTKSGKKLGVFVNCLRYGSRKITLEQKEKLNKLGFIWDTRIGV